MHAFAGPFRRGPPARPSHTRHAMPPFAHARFDAHVHLWGPLDGHTATMLGSTPGTPPPPGDPAALLAALDAAGVAGACVVQPACYGYDHTYVGGVVAASGGRLTGCALADPTASSPAAAAVTTAALLAPGSPFSALRFNPYLWPAGPEAMADPVGLAMAAAAGEAGAPVCVMAFKGLAPLLPALRALAASCPATPFILDHCGFAGVGRGEDAAALTALAAEYPDTMHVKASALFRLGGGTAWPFAGAVGGPVRAALAAFGPGRVLAGTDWPWVTDFCSYGEAWAALDGVWEGWEPESGGMSGGEARAAVEGGNAARLFRWKSESG